VRGLRRAVDMAARGPVPTDRGTAPMRRAGQDGAVGTAVGRWAGGPVGPGPDQDGTVVTAAGREPGRVRTGP
jgi:hypothetical protein